MPTKTCTETMRFFEGLRPGEIVRVDKLGNVSRTNGARLDFSEISSDHVYYDQIIYAEILESVISAILEMSAGLSLVYKRACTENGITVEALSKPPYGYKAPLCGDDKENQYDFVEYFEFEVVAVDVEQ